MEQLLGLGTNTASLPVGVADTVLQVESIGASMTAAISRHKAAIDRQVVVVGIVNVINIAVGQPIILGVSWIHIPTTAPAAIGATTITTQLRN